jgi:hypothetical protein
MFLFKSLVLIGFVFSAIIGQNADDTRAILHRSAAINSADSATLSNATASALRSAKVPGGIVFVGGCGNDPMYTFSHAGPTLEDALHSVIRSNPRYEWTIVKGVVNVRPVNGELSLLSVNMRNVEIKKAYSLDLVASELLSVAEVRRRMTELNFTPGYVRLGMNDLPRSTDTRMKEPPAYQFRNVTLREALDSVARRHGTAVWEYRENHCKGKTEVQLQFLVR